MSTNIIHEVSFFIHAMILGAVITFVYDWLRILRRVVVHNVFFISIEDLFFWIGCSIEIFLMLYEENNGMLRWFAIVGSMLGMFCYKLLLGQFFVKYVSLFLRWGLQKLGIALRYIGRPMRKMGRKSRQCSRKIQHGFRLLWKIGKNRLTFFVKMVKIILCKQ